MNDGVVAEALELARIKEKQEQKVIKEIYILDNQIYFSRYELKGCEPDFTLSRNVDETSTRKQYKERTGF